MIVESGNYYVIQVKGNQPKLFKEIQNNIVLERPLDYFEEHQKDHGRRSSWFVHVYDAQESPLGKQWKNLRRFIHVHKRTIIKGEEKHSNRLYISDLYSSDAQKYHEGIRGHWSIENSLHWVKDVVHNEDGNTIKTANGPMNYAVFSSIAINMHRKVGTRSITDSQAKCNANINKVFNFLKE